MFMGKIENFFGHYLEKISNFKYILVIKYILTIKYIYIIYILYYNANIKYYFIFINIINSNNYNSLFYN